MFLVGEDMNGIVNDISNLASMRAIQLNRLATRQSQHRLATGRRINAAADNPAALIASLRMDATLADLEAETDANHRAMRIADTADAALGQISDQLVEARRLALANANDAGLSADEKHANQLELDAILTGVDRLARSTSFHGTRLLDGSASISASGAKLTIDAVTTTDIDPTHPDSIDAAISKVSTLRGKIGGFSRHTLQSRLNQLATEQTTLVATTSLIRDADIAAETSARSRSHLLEAAATLILKTPSLHRSLLDVLA
jgi:flagellin-like hook-associated protein FlgL